MTESRPTAFALYKCLFALMPAVATALAATTSLQAQITALPPAATRADAVPTDPVEPIAAAPTRMPTSITSTGRGDITGTGALSDIAPGDTGSLPSAGGVLPGAGDRRGIGGSAISAALSYRIMDVKGLPNGPGERYDTTVQEVTPSVSWLIGNHWSVAYAPSWVFYTNDDLEDSVDHTGSVAWRTSFENWRLALDHRSSHTNSVSIETAEQTERTQHLTSFSTGLELNSWLSWNQQFRHNLRSSERFADYREYSVDQSIARRFGERLYASAGAVYGYVDMSDGANHQYLSPRINGSWQLSEKTSLSGFAGVEHRWFSDELGDTTNPVFDLSLAWTPVEATSFTLSYNRGVSPSLFTDTVARRESIDAALTQRFLGRYFLTVTASRRTARFNSIEGAELDGRRDRTTRFGARLGTQIGPRGSISVFYFPEADNDSNRSIYSYSVRTYGAELSYRF